MEKEGLLFCLGLALTVFCGVPLSLLCAFASMAPPGLKGWNYWSFVVGKLFDLSEFGLLSLMAASGFVAGITLLVWGSCVLTRSFLNDIASRKG
jgi:hypothetical protein